MENRPLRVAALIAAEPHAHALMSRLSLPHPPRFDSCAALLADGTVEPGLVLVCEPVSFPVAAALARDLRESVGEWVVAVVERDTDDALWVAQPVTAGFPQGLDHFLAQARGDAPGPLLEVTPILEYLGRARHDINNPLTAALAETQLLLMDVADPRVRQSLETIQGQIRRIRDLVAEMDVLRPPD